jgi:hypothetical protein
MVTLGLPAPAAEFLDAPRSQPACRDHVVKGIAAGLMKLAPLRRGIGFHIPTDEISKL